jgi:hypothetical protein
MSCGASFDVLLVLFGAFTLAKERGAQEIGLEDLSRALDRIPQYAPVEGTSGPFEPARAYELSFSSDVRAMLESVGNLADVTVECLRAGVNNRHRRPLRT